MSQPRYDMTGHWKLSDRGQRSCLGSGEGPGVGRSGVSLCHDNSLLGNKKLQSYQHIQLVLTEIQPTLKEKDNVNMSKTTVEGDNGGHYNIYFQKEMVLPPIRTCKGAIDHFHVDR